MGRAVKNDLKKIVDMILKETDSVIAIYLFGSMARGTQDELSDYDIAVITEKYPIKDVDTIARIKFALLSAVKRPVEIVFMDLKDLTYSSPILYEVYHNHKLLYGPDIVLNYNDSIKNVRPIIQDGKTIGYYV